MLRSMTAFAAAESTHDFGTLAIEIRSVNQRFLDISLRLPDELRVLEHELRERVKSRLARGKIEATIRWRPDGSQQVQHLDLNRELAQTLIDAHHELAAMAGQDTANADLVQLLRWPELLIEQPADIEPVRARALDLFDQAVTQLVAGREREGTALAGLIRARLDEVATWVGQVRVWLPDIQAQLRARFEQRLGELATPVEPGRLEQEVALQLQKLDVAEELDRLDAHCQEVTRMLEADKPAGRRLDFFMQELNREANTLASKSIDARTSKAAVELKVLIEQMREQVQNIE